MDCRRQSELSLFSCRDKLSFVIRASEQTTSPHDRFSIRNVLAPLHMERGCTPCDSQKIPLSVVDVIHYENSTDEEPAVEEFVDGRIFTSNGCLSYKSFLNIYINGANHSIHYSSIPDALPPLSTWRGDAHLAVRKRFR